MVHPWSREHVPSPFTGPITVSERVGEAGQPPGQCVVPQGRQVSRGLCHSTQGHILVGSLEDGDVVVDLGTVPLGDALGNPHNVATLLLLELHKSVENTKVELVQEGQLVQFHLWTEAGVVCAGGRVGPEAPTPPYDGSPGPHLMLKESVLQGLVSRVAACTLKEQFVLLAQGNGRKQERECNWV